ncbi:MAG: hypothetical protein HPY68_08670 [Candidatus Atribacteria bacterium]|nr:hypothetical protein [Candidatus Atribacteria bacterium]
MKRWSVVLFLILFLWNPLTLMAREKSVEFTTYRASLASFCVDIPKNWEVENPPQSLNPYLVFLAWNPETQVEVTLEYKDFGSFDRFRERVREDIIVFPNVTITGEGETTIDHSPAYWFDYLFEEENTEMQGRLYLFTRNQGFYRIICLSSRKHFQRYLPIFEHITQSFTFVTDRDESQ